MKEYTVMMIHDKYFFAIEMHFWNTRLYKNDYVLQIDKCFRYLKSHPPWPSPDEAERNPALKQK